MTASSKTIAAALTAHAAGAIAVVVIRGAHAPEAAARVCRTRAGKAVTSLPMHRPRLLHLVDAGDTIDEAIVVRCDHDSASIIEIYPHGGVRIVERILTALRAAGAEIVSAAEFMDRVADDPIRRDVDRALVTAGSRRLAAWLLAQRRLLPAFLGNLPSQDDDAIEAFLARTRIAIPLVRGLRIGIIGPPNAGKSTLANRLIGHDRIITSDQAGTTRDWIDAAVTIDGWPMTLTDTAGLRDTDCAVESEAIRRAGREAAQCDLVIVLLDATESQPAQAAARQAAEARLRRGQPRLIALNKQDALSPAARAHQPADAVCVSAQTGCGMDLLEARIVAMLGLDAMTTTAPAGFLTRHLALDRRCV